MSKSPSKVLSKSPSNVLNPVKSNLDKKPSKANLSKLESDRKSSSRNLKAPSSSKIQSLDHLLGLIEEIMDEKARYNNKNF